MNDKELDELLNQWKTPAVSASMRETVRARIAVKQRKPLWTWFWGWKPVAAATAVFAIAVVLTNTYAFPRKDGPPPFIVESEITRYDDFDCLMCWLLPAYPGPSHARMTSYNENGSEVVLSWFSPGKLRLPAALWSAKLAVSGAFDNIGRLIPLMPELEPPDYYAGVYTAVNERRGLGSRDNLVRYSCRPTGRAGEFIGEEVVLGYPTVIVRDGLYKGRVTLWMAPELSCFALRATVETEQPDGSWSMVSEKNALKVTLNR